MNCRGGRGMKPILSKEKELLLTLPDEQINKLLYLAMHGEKNEYRGLKERSDQYDKKTADVELGELVGLEETKLHISKLVSFYKMQFLC